MINAISIRFELNGWSVNAGCQNLVYTDPRTLLADMTDWLADPIETEKRFLEKSAINRRFTLHPLVSPAEMPPGPGPVNAYADMVAATAAPRRLDR